MMKHGKKIGIIVLSALPAFASAQSASGVLNSTTGATLQTIVGKLVGFINLLVPVLASAAIVFFFYGLVRFIRNSGDSKGRAVGRDAIVWGLIGMFVIISLWGIVNFIQAAFSLPTSSPQNQQSYPTSSSATPAEKVQQGVTPI